MFTTLSNQGTELGLRPALIFFNALILISLLPPSGGGYGEETYNNVASMIYG